MEFCKSRRNAVRTQWPVNSSIKALVWLSFYFCGVSSQLVLADSMDLDIDGDAQQSVVVTPTKLKQSIADVPAPVTIIDHAKIKALGYPPLPELMRLVPGMIVSQITSSSYIINYHGMSNDFPRRMQVLVDGVSLYRNGLAQVDWLQLPFNVEDIKRIEVTRSPSGAVYGVNSFQAVVNIILNKPSTNIEGNLLRVSASETQHRTFGRWAKTDPDMSYFLSVSSERNAGSKTRYSEVVDNPLQPFGSFSTNTDGHDGFNGKGINLSISKSLNSRNTLNSEFAIADGEGQVRDSGHFFQVSHPDVKIRDYLVNVQDTQILSPTNDLTISYNLYRGERTQHWLAQYPAGWLYPELRDLYLQNLTAAYQLGFYGNSNVLQYSRSPLDTLLILRVLNKANAVGVDNLLKLITGELNQDYIDTKHTVEVSDSVRFTDALQIISSLGFGYNSFESATFVGGGEDATVSQQRYWALSSAEYKPSNTFTFNFGGMFETDNINNNNDFMPRAGVSYHYSENHTAKFVVSDGRRSPNVIETQMNWRYKLTDFDQPVNGKTSGSPFFGGSFSDIYGIEPNHLVSEKNRATQFILTGGLFYNTLNYEVNFYHEKYSDLISTRLATMPPNNDGSGVINGYELQLNSAITKKLDASFGYSHINNQIDSEFEHTLNSPNTRFFNLIYSSNDWFSSLAGYSMKIEGADQYKRIDTLLGKKYPGESGREFHWDVKLSYTPSDTQLVYEGVLSTMKNARWQTMVELGYRF